MSWSNLVVKAFVLCVGLAPAAADVASADPAEAEAAVAKLAVVRSPANLEALLDALAVGLHPQVTAAAIRAIATYGEPRTFETLAVYCKHRNKDVRQAALVAVASSKDRRAEGYIRAGLDDFSPEVRAEALAAVTRRKLRGAAPTLLTLLERGDAGAADALAAVGDAEIARQIAERIGKIPDRSLAQALGGLLRRKDFGPGEVRLDVVKTIAKLPGDVAVPALELYVAKVPEDSKKRAGLFAKAILDQRKEKKQP